MRKEFDATRLQSDVLVIGGGPGGYTAAFRAADLGRKVILVERHALLGGVCLNVGCIPSKSLLHVARSICDAESMGAHGIEFGRPRLDLERIRQWKDGIVGRLAEGLGGLAQARRIQVVQGLARFLSPRAVRVQGQAGTFEVGFDDCVIATGSRSIKLEHFPDDARVMDSTGALALRDIPSRLLVVGGGIVGLELGAVYHALGSRVTVAEAGPQLVPGADEDVVKPLADRLRRRYEGILLNTTVSALEPVRQGLRATFASNAEQSPETYDKVLVAVGRCPNTGSLDLEQAGLAVDARGLIEVDGQMRTRVPGIYAVGDVTVGPMLAHKAVHQGKIAAEAIAGSGARFDPRAIPSVAYTDPEVAWTGLTEREAKARGVAYEKSVFPWKASGRAWTNARPDGVTKLIYDRQSRRLLGAAVTGIGAGDLISEAIVAIEMDADVGDLALAVHPHPTLSETMGLAAEMAEGTITDLLPARKAG